VARAPAAIVHPAVCKDYTHEADEIVFRRWYFGRNLRAIEVLIDRKRFEPVSVQRKRGSSTILGTATVHTTSSINVRTGWPVQNVRSTSQRNLQRQLLLEGKSNLLRMRQEIPLSEAELAALDDGVSALESLLNRLADVPTPAGQTPVQLRGESLVQIDAAQAADRSLNVQKGPPTMSEGPMYRRS